MSTMSVTINGNVVETQPGQTILEVARAQGIKIPTLCHMKNLLPSGSCRVCVVEVEGMNGLIPSCAYPVSDGMRILTHSTRVRRARKTLIELLLANHPDDCLYCLRNGSCELQDQAIELGVRERRYRGAKRQGHVDNSSPAIERDPNKCILCGRCVRVCDEVQGVGAIDFVGRGFDTQVVPAFDEDLEKSNCTYCGQCVLVCPTGALRERSSLQAVWGAISDPKKTVIVQLAPAVRVSLAEEYGLEYGTDITGRLVTGLRRIGFDKVFDTNFAADLTVMEEGNELVQRLGEGGTLPLITSCSPGWVKFCEHYYPQLLPNLSTAKSPQQMFGAIAKTYYAKKKGILPKDLFVVSVMPCTAKKFEAGRPEMGRDGYRDVDAVLTTRELLRMLSIAGVDLMDLGQGQFDHPLGESSGASAIFGTTGGVAEAALRTAHYLVTGEDLTQVRFTSLRGREGVREATVKVGDLELRCAVAHGLANARKLMERILAGEANYHFVEVMGCPGGCVGGGGQLMDLEHEHVYKRALGLYKIDEASSIRCSHHNRDIQDLYKSFLGEPLGEKSHRLLHTRYQPRVPQELTESDVAATTER